MPEINGMDTAGILTRLMQRFPLIMFRNLRQGSILQRELSWAGIRQVVSKSDGQGLVQALEEAFSS